MTVSTENCYAERRWTGVETAFAGDFPAKAAADVTVRYVPDGGSDMPLVQGTHFSVTIDPVTGEATVLPLALPAAPGWLQIERVTPALQPTDFANLAKFSPAVHTDLHDRAALRDAENTRRIAPLIKALQELAARVAALESRP